ncbi:hypothetical protein E2986_12757 [Frieseomelitta varia]|uniref:Uncharacterized protein n=1 Tax=Frieseomelitta varia TaxID=561572 RepID=A0A833S679_9HYME|nr:hypothetical protein E2986_12757 [Frieseomelitta varia]
MPPRHQSPWLQRNHLGKQLNISLPSQLLMKPHSLKHQRKAVTCCITFMYSICRKGRNEAKMQQVDTISQNNSLAY